MSYRFDFKDLEKEISSRIIFNKSQEIIAYLKENKMDELIVGVFNHQVQEAVEDLGEQVRELEDDESILRKRVEDLRHKIRWLQYIRKLYRKRIWSQI